MADVTVPSPASRLLSLRAVLPAFLVLAVVLVIVFSGGERGVAVYPETMELRFEAPLDEFLKGVATDWRIGPVAIKDLTQGFSDIIGAPIVFLDGLLVEGFFFEIGERYIELVPLSWVGTSYLLVLVPLLLGGWRVGLMAGATLAYALAFGLWTSLVVTLISVLFSVVLASILGLLLGVWGSRSDVLSALLRPLYDALQTVPVFSYLTIILVFFGFGPVAALIATVIFAVAPMARTTELALRQTPSALSELASITGCTRFQRLVLVELPAARGKLLIGVNQVTMLSLAMVIIASIIGAGGLGSDVLRGLKSLRLTEALLAGLAISFLAITIDRTLRALTSQSSVRVPWSRRAILTVLGLAILPTLAAFWIEPFVFAPEDPWIDVGRGFDAALSDLNIVIREQFGWLQDGFVRYIMVPFRNSIAALPWMPTVIFVGLLAVWLSGPGTGLLCACLMASLAVLGLWDQAMLSLYLVLLSLFVAFVFGFPIGVLAGMNERFFHIVEIISDLIQTLPTFVYLIPVVVLFGAGDFPALVAIIIYLLAPIVRYTAHGLQQVSSSTLREAADMTGCTAMQRLRLVLMPIAAPQIVLGLNQAVMLGFGMLVITSLVGSRGLEEATLVAVAQVKPGQGILAGYGIAALAIVLDRLLRGVADRMSANSHLRGR